MLVEHYFIFLSTRFPHDAECLSSIAETAWLSEETCLDVACPVLNG
jgi:hypothetical protein